MLSQRSRILVELARSKVNNDYQSPKNEKKEDVYCINSSNESDPISNWVIEVDPKILKMPTFGDKSIFHETIDRFGSEYEASVSNGCAETSQHSQQDIIREFNYEEVREKTSENNPPKEEMENMSPKIKILSHLVIRDNMSKQLSAKHIIYEDGLFSTDAEKVDELKSESPAYHVPLIVVPPKKTLEHIPVADNLPILVEAVEIDEIKSSNNDMAISEDHKNSFGNMEVDDDSITARKERNELELEEYVEVANAKHYKDKMTFCFYCEKDVTHFPRHLATWHRTEIEVERIFSFTPKSKERRIALSVLGKKGNYLKNRSASKIRPVRRVERKQTSSLSADQFLPCSHCLGFYKRNHLYRHTKVCSSRSNSVITKRQTSQSDGQTALLLGTFRHDQLLKKELFPRMRADVITLIAKKDTLICDYAYSYLKGRRSKGNLDCVRQNTRRLAKLLQYAKNQTTNITDFIDLLRPSHFQIIINGVNKIGCYNSETDIYESPTVAINFGTLIKKCCDLAYLQLIQKENTEIRRKELKILKTLVESQWANEISAQACNDLSSKKWNKEQLLPLTSDLEKLKHYLEKEAANAFENLHVNPSNQESYTRLKEVLYTQIILLNRRRPAEVAQLKIQTYKSVNLECQESEFVNCLTETEKILLKTCCRIVVRGKRGRGVPILLLSQKMREHFDLLVQVRSNFVDSNDYIFHTSGTSFIDGTKILNKYAVKCGAANPKSISATRLRKHLATVTQLLQCSQKDLEQVSKFMGHTLKTHCDFYRLSDNLYQTAKMSKLLLLATEKGALDKYKGMTLDQIDIDLTPISEEERVEAVLADATTEYKETESPQRTESFPSDTAIEQKSSALKIPIQKVSWTAREKRLISEYFAGHIEKKQAPKRSEVEEFTEQYSQEFIGRKWTTIKAVVYNIYTGKLAVPV